MSARQERQEPRSMQRRVCYQIRSEEVDEESEHTEKQRQNKTEINTYLQQRVFSSLH